MPYSLSERNVAFLVYVPLFMKKKVKCMNEIFTVEEFIIYIGIQDLSFR